MSPEERLQVVKETLEAEAAWLETAYANSAGRFPAQREGFGQAAGWVRFHAENPELVKVPE